MVQKFKKSIIPQNKKGKKIVEKVVEEELSDEIEVDDQEEDHSDTSDEDGLEIDEGDSEDEGADVNDEVEGDDDDDSEDGDEDEDDDDDSDAEAQQVIKTSTNKKGKKSEVEADDSDDDDDDDDDDEADSDDDDDDAEKNSDDDDAEKDSDDDEGDEPSPKKAKTQAAKPKHQEDVSKTVFVGHLDFKTTDEELKQFFSKAGEVVKARVIPRKGFGFVEFADEAGVLEALKLEKAKFNSREIHVERSKSGMKDKKNLKRKETESSAKKVQKKVPGKFIKNPKHNQNKGKGPQGQAGQKRKYPDDSEAGSSPKKFKKPFKPQQTNFNKGPKPNKGGFKGKGKPQKN